MVSHTSTRQLAADMGQHFRTGVAYMLPVLLIGGLLGSIGVLGKGSSAPIWMLCREIGEIGLAYFVPVMAAYVAFSIADTAGIAPGLVVGVLAQRIDAGYLGALLGALLVGYLCRWLLNRKVPELWESTWGMLAPAVATAIVSVTLFFVLGPPIAAMMRGIGESLVSLETSGGAAMGAVMGALGGVDYGGPFSKTQSTFATAAIDLHLYTPLGICGAIVTVPPLGMCLAVYLAPRLYSESEQKYARQSWVYALVAGFTEIVIPLAVNDLARVTAATVVGCVVAGTLAGAFGLQLMTPVLGIPQWFFYDQPVVYAFSVAAGVLSVAFVANFLKRATGRPPTPSESSNASFDQADSP